MKTKSFAIFFATLITIIAIAGIIFLYAYTFRSIPNDNAVFIMFFFLSGLWIGIFVLFNPKQESLEDQIDQVKNNPAPEKKNDNEFL